jgi:type IV secretory pathway VirB10-like protein
MNKFTCDKHGDFTGGGKYRGFCPKCGQSFKRIFEEGESNGGTETATEPIVGDGNPTGEQQPSNNSGESPATETPQPEKPVKREIKVTKRVKVKVKKPTVTTPTTSKKVTGPKRPQVKARVKTNKEKAMEHDAKSSTTWSWARKAGFGR